MKHLFLGILLSVAAGSAELDAHAFLKSADPAVGSTVQTSPGQVRISFTEKIEPALSTIQVLDASGKEVSKHDTRVDHSNQRLLCVNLSSLEAGTYKVVWRVTSHDSHVTKGSFSFRIAR